MIEDDAVSLVSARRHGNKLRAGHLAGNRFHIRVRGVGDDAEGRARAILDDLTKRGVPNRFGPQFPARGG